MSHMEVCIFPTPKQVPVASFFPHHENNLSLLCEPVKTKIRCK